MEHLRRQYRTIIISIFGIATAASVLLASILQKSPLTNDLLDYVVRAAPAALAGIALLAYEAFGWRLANSKLDFAGEWVFSETQYIVDPQTGTRTRDFDAWGTARFVQGPHHFALARGETRKGAIPSQPQTQKADSIWHSIASEIRDGGQKIHLCIHHDSSFAPETPLGYAVEIMNVTGANWRGAPNRMSSEVLLCADAKVPRVVVCHYERGSLEDFCRRRARSNSTPRPAAVEAGQSETVVRSNA